MTFFSIFSEFPCEDEIESKSMEKISLSSEQTKLLEESEFLNRINVLEYLNENLEVRAFIRELLGQLLQHMPNNVPNFLRNFFNKNPAELKEKIVSHVIDMMHEKTYKAYATPNLEECLSLSHFCKLKEKPCDDDYLSRLLFSRYPSQLVDSDSDGPMERICRKQRHSFLNIPSSSKSVKQKLS